MTSLKDLPRVPWFVHDYVWDLSKDSHTYKGSLARHLAVERTAFHLFKGLTEWDATWLYPLANFFQDLVLGLNCGFPPRDVMLYALCNFKSWEEKYWR